MDLVAPLLLSPPAALGVAAQEVLRAEAIQVEDRRIRPAEIYQDVPVETEVLTAEDLRDTPGVEPIEALEAIPGLRISSRVQGQRGAVRIDGLPEEYTEIYVNGQRYAGENGEAIDLGDQLYFDIDRVEILRGPQALRHSARAGGGVINFITREPPTDGFAVGGQLARGDQGRAAYKSTLGYGTERLGGTVIFQRLEEDGFDDPFPGSTDPRDGLPTPFGEGSEYITNDVYATLAGRPSERVEVRSRFGYRLRDEAFAIDDGPITARREDERWLGNLETDIDVTDSTRLYAKLTVFHNTTTSDAGREFELIDDLERLQVGFEQFLELGDTTHLLVVGGDAFSSGIDLREGEIPDTIVNPSLGPQQTQRRYFQGGLFVVTESELTDWLSFEVGLRLEQNSDFDAEWLPQAALLLTPHRWDAERALKLRLSAGRAARYPTLRELYQPAVPQNGGAYFLAGNPDLVQETVWAMRASVEVTPVRWLSATATGFYNQTDGRIRSRFQGTQIQVDETFIPADPALCPIFPDRCNDQTIPVLASVFEADNLDDLETWGIEARVELRPWEWAELQLGYTWTRTKLSDSNIATDELPNSPPHILNGKLELIAPWIDTRLTTRASWRDRAYVETSGTGLVSFVSNDRSRDSYEIDVRLLQPLERWLGVEVDLFVDGDNLNDNRVVDSYQVRGRSFLAGIQGRWD
jgi:outer membrane receptor protein involved in Fe transport